MGVLPGSRTGRAGGAPEEPCPDCHTVFTTVNPNISLKNYINDLSAVILDEEEKKKREETIEERLEKNKKPILGEGKKNETPIISLAQNALNLAAESAPADLNTAGAGVGAIQGEEPNRCMHRCECLHRGQQCTHTRLALMCINCSQLLAERQQNIPGYLRHQHTMEVLRASIQLSHGQAPTLSRSQIFLSSPNTASLAPPMNLVERNIQGQTPALGQTPVAPTLPRSQLLSARNAPSLAPPMNLVEPDSTTLDIQYFRHFNGPATTRNLPRPSPYIFEQDRPRRFANQTCTLGALWNPR